MSSGDISTIILQVWSRVLQLGRASYKGLKPRVLKHLQEIIWYFRDDWNTDNGDLAPTPAWVRESSSPYPCPGASCTPHTQGLQYPWVARPCFLIRRHVGGVEGAFTMLLPPRPAAPHSEHTQRWRGRFPFPSYWLVDHHLLGAWLNFLLGFFFCLSDHWSRISRSVVAY